jgi:hypothetical protein
MDMNELHHFLLFSGFFIFTCGSSFYFFQIFSFSLVRVPFFPHLLKGPLIWVFLKVIHIFPFSFWESSFDFHMKLFLFYFN